MSDSIRLEISDRIAEIVLNRPDRLNAFNRELCMALIDAVRAVAGNDEVGAVILTGAGRAFSSGADLKEGIVSDQALVERLNREFLPSIDGLRRMDKPVIAAVNGPAAGIAVAFLLACDLAVMDREAYMMQPFVNISLVPDGGITWELARLMGHKRAYEFIVSGQQLDAQACSELGLVNRVSEPGQALQQARSWARELLDKAPLALRYSKEALRHNADVAFGEGFRKEAELQEICAHSEDAAEGVRAFVEKRPPRFSGQ